MPSETFTFEEATSPEEFSFEEAQAKPDPQDRLRGMTQEQLRAEMERVRTEGGLAGRLWRGFGRTESLIPPPLLPPEAPGSIEHVAGPSTAGRLVAGAARGTEQVVRGLAAPENLPLIPLAAVSPPAASAMALYFGGQALGAGAGQISAAQTPEEVGAGLAQIGVGGLIATPTGVKMTRGLLRQVPPLPVPPAAPLSLPVGVPQVPPRIFTAEQVARMRDFPRAMDELRRQAEEEAYQTEAVAALPPLTQNQLRIMAERLAQDMGARLVRTEPKPTPTIPEETQNAVLKQQAKTPIRGLPSQPISDVGQVPAKEGAPGVPPSGVPGDVTRDVGKEAARQPEVLLKPADEISRIAAMSGKQFNDWATGQKGKGGFTAAADRLGDSIATVEELAALKKAWEESLQKGKKLPQEKMTDERLQEMMGVGYQEQFFSEAYGRATGTGSAGELARKTVPGYAPKFGLKEGEVIEPKPPAPTEAPIGGSQSSFLTVPASQWTSPYVRQQVARGQKPALVTAINTAIKPIDPRIEVSTKTSEPTLLKHIQTILRARQEAVSGVPPPPAPAKAETPSAAPVTFAAVPAVVGEIPTLSEFKKQLADHDWTYDFSDDPATLRRGKDVENRLVEIAKTGGDTYKRAFNEERLKVFSPATGFPESGPFFTEVVSKPTPSPAGPAMSVGPGAASPREFVEREQNASHRPGPEPPDLPPAQVQQAQMNPDQRINLAVRTKDVMPMRDFFASPEFEFRDIPEAGSYVTRLLEAVLGFKARAARSNEALLKNLWDKLSRPDQLTLTKAMRDVYKGDLEAVRRLPENLRDVADRTRAYFDLTRERITEVKRQDLIEALPDARRGALKEILDGGIPDEVFKSWGLRGAGRKAVMDALEELQDLRRWGLDNYVTNIELGSYRVLTEEGTTIAVGETVSSATAKARRYLAEHPETKTLTIDDSYNGPREVPTKLSRGAYYRTISRLANELNVSSRKIQDALRAEGQPAITIKPSLKYAKPLQKRYDILAGEDTLADSLGSYIFSIEKKLALDPLLKEAKNLLPKLPENASKQIEVLIDQAKGTRSVSDQIADYLLSPFGIRPFAASRGVNVLRDLTTGLKLGYRPVSALVNRLGGLHATWTKVGTHFLLEGRRLRKSREWEELWDRNKDFVGWDSSLASVEGANHPIMKVWQPLGMFQLAERVNRPEAFAAFYEQARQSMGMEGLQAEAYARWMTRLTQNIYDPIALPRSMRGPAGRLVFQFKPYLVKHLEMLATLRGPEIPRYLTGFLAIGGPRAAIFMLRSLPIIGAIGLLANLEDWLNRKYPRGARGVGALAGVDVTAAVTPQLPTQPEDFMGPVLSDVYKLGRDVVFPALKGAKRDWSDLAEWGARLAPALFYWRMLVQSNLNDQGWTEDARGRLRYQPKPADRIKYLMGAKPIEQATQEVEARYLRETEAIFRENRSRSIREYLEAAKKGDAVEVEKRLKELQEYGVTAAMVRNAMRSQHMVPQERLWRSLSKERRRQEIERFTR